MAITEKQRYELKKVIKELGSHKARHTELISVYIPQGYELSKIINHLQQEQGTATNIKDSTTRKNVIDALERMVQHLRLFKATPENGLAIFSGNVAAREGQQDFKVWSLEPPIPLKTRIYRCDKEFVLDLLVEMLETKEVYGLVVMDRRDGDIALLKGKTIIPLVRKKSNVPGKTRAGGQCCLKGSLVQVSNGEILKIEDCHNPLKTKSMVMSDYSVKDSPIIDKWHVKKQKIFKIITKNPRLVLESSKDHVFFVPTDKGVTKKAAEELKMGDYLIMPEKIEIEGELQEFNPLQYHNAFLILENGRRIIEKQRKKLGLLQKELAKKTGGSQSAISLIELGKRNVRRNFLEKVCEGLNIGFEQFLDRYTVPQMYRNIKLPNKVDESFAQFIGYYIGDGCVERGRITLYEQDKNMAINYKKKFERYFNAKIGYRFRKNRNCHQLRLTSKPLVRLVRKEFPEIKKALDSEIPKKILRSKDKIAAAFLRGLFDAEGYVSKNQKVGIGMNNKVLIQQLQILLLRFGIISSFLEYDNRRNVYSKNIRYVLEISERESLKKFRNVIGFSSHNKIKKLDGLVKTKSNVSYVRQILIPGDEIRKMIEREGYIKQQFPKVSNFFYNTRMISKQAFKNSILKYAKDKKLYKKLEEVYDYPFLPVKINRIEIVNKPSVMVDISVENQNFIANGIIVHNSAARYERIREGAAKDFYKRIAEAMKEEFLGKENLKGIIVGGPGPTKYDFVDGGFITNEVKKKIIAIKDLSYTGDFGLEELVDKSQDVLANEEIADEKQVMGKFFELLSKRQGMVAYGEREVMGKLKIGAVDILLLSEGLEDEKIDEFEKEAKLVATTVKIISTETREGAQLRDLGKVAAILRYEN